MPHIREVAIKAHAPHSWVAYPDVADYMKTREIIADFQKSAMISWPRGGGALDEKHAIPRPKLHKQTL